jgi:hypothetical protein
MNETKNPFGPPESATASGRVKGASAEELRSRGLDAHGHPDQYATGKPAGQSQRVHRPGGTRGQNLSQLVQSIGSMELSNQDDLHAFCEGYRALLNYLAVSAHMAQGQLKAAARAQARQASTGRLNPMQAAKMAATLGMIGRNLSALANNCAAGAAESVKAWRRFEIFLDELENDGTKSNRPGGRRGGFTVV